MTIAQALNEATKSLSNCQRPRLEAELLLAFYLDRDRTYLLTHDDEVLQNRDEYFDLIKRRALDEPYEYISQKVSFYDTYLFVKSGVLVPRPETELLIDEVSMIIEQEKLTHIAEIGVGSGAISIILARKFPHLQIVATDISSTALNIAQINIQKFNLQDRIELVQTNLLDGINNKFELVVSNPPYIAEDEQLEPNVAHYEPHEALFGGKIGDEVLKAIINEATKRDISWLACEMGYDQKESMERYLTQFGVQYLKFYDDLAGLNRGFITQF